MDDASAHAAPAHATDARVATGSSSTVVRDVRTRWLGDPRGCIAADCALLALAAATAAVCALDTPHVARLVLLLAAACLIPGSALLTLLAVEDPLEACGLAVGLGFTVEAVGALVMVWTGWWHPFGWAILLGGVACLLLTLDLRRNVALVRRSV
jgi:hypothetical protein